MNGLLSYTHDAVRNRLALASTLAALGSQAKSYDANDRLTDETYDANGSTLAANGWTYGYEFEDRLVTATKAGVSVAMQYDGDGNRVVRTEGATTVRYLVDDLTPTGYVQVAEEVVAGSVAQAYVHGPQRVSQRQLVGGVWSFSYYGYDESMGSARLVADAAGSATDRYSYDGFGNVVARSGSTANSYLYRGEQFDLPGYYLRARWYDAVLGTFKTADTHEGKIAEPHTLHLFIYGHAEPVRYFDPSGHGITFRGIVSALMAGPVAVIGRVAQTTRFSCVPYCNVLSQTGWSELVQAEWLKSVIQGRVIIVLASPTTVQNIVGSPRHNEGLTVFGMELVSLLEAGYTQWGRLMLPPM